MASRIARMLLALTIVLFVAGAWTRDEIDSADTIAMLIELSGRVETQVDGRPVSVSMLAEFVPGSRLRLHKDAKVLLLFYRSGEQYAVGGPSLIRFHRAGLEALSGSEPVRKPALQGKDGRTLTVRAAGVAQAGMVVRGSNRPISPLNPAGAITLEPRPTFRWREFEAGIEYHFILRDSNGRILLDRVTRGGSLELPAQVALGEGEHYRWSLSARAPDGAYYALNQKLSLADPGMRSDVENFRPGADAIAGDRIVFAVWLEQAGLKDEAARYWRELAVSGLRVPPDKIEPGW